MRSEAAHITAIKRQKPHNLSITHLINVNVSAERLNYVVVVSCVDLVALESVSFLLVYFSR